jgi:hypothetical protein
LILTAAATCYPSVEMVEETRMVEGREGENTSSLEQCGGATSKSAGDNVSDI